MKWMSTGCSTSHVPPQPVDLACPDTLHFYGLPVLAGPVRDAPPFREGLLPRSGKCKRTKSLRCSRRSVRGQVYGGIAMYAVIRAGGKQYRVAPGDVIEIEKVPQAGGENVQFDDVLASRAVTARSWSSTTSARSNTRS